MAISSPLAIKSHELTKRFGDYVAVDKLSLEIPTGQIFGLLGPNAAGKSTTIRLLAGILGADGGAIEILGQDLATNPDLIKQRIGYVAQNFALYPELTVAENLEFYFEIYNQTDTAIRDRLLAEYSLAQFATRRAGALSGGYKRRLSIACALAHDPELVFLDEPTAGIDPISRKDLWDGLYRLASAGKTLFVTTHYMEEAERCNRLAFIHHGRLVADGTPTEIKQSLASSEVYSCSCPYNPTLVAELESLDGVRSLNQFGDELRIISDQSHFEALAGLLSKHGYARNQISEVAPSIEDAFIALTTGVD